GNIDIGSIIGSYIALLLLSSLYTAIGIFCSSITNNQIVAFISAVFLCFIFYFGFSNLVDYDISISFSSFVEQLGVQM
ncbi:gliding motility-associated ABC transporter permease subunit GldF, partial [Aquimarina celericrescens]|nr:gliding motility-associated ABC transporter permease subunit GldF [Aquimarina celericrescens]